MSQAVRTSLTMLVLGGLLLGAALWGWSAATEPLPAQVDPPICVDTPVSTGDEIDPEEVTVTVYNASDRAGLADRTMQALMAAGFAEGQMGNVKARVQTAVIWADSPTNPAVQLVADYLGPGVKIEQRDSPGVGVNVVVGEKFGRVVKGVPSVISEEDTEICSPPVD